MSIKQVKNKIIEYIINGQNNIEQKKVGINKVLLESYTNIENSNENNFIPLIDINYNNNNNNNNNNKKYHITPLSNPSSKNDNLTNIYIIGISCLGLYILNSFLKKK